MSKVNSQGGALAGSAAAIALCLSLPLLCMSSQVERQLTVMLELVPDPPGRETVTLRATVKNVSMHKVLIAVWDPLEDYSLSVTDPKGAPVPLSKRGKEFFSPDRIRYRSANVEVTLQPGETRIDIWAIDDFFQFVRPGCYLITARRDFGMAHEVDSSNTLEVVLK